ncbi:MAG TPA: NADP-dependent malic enzyme [Fimbriimonadaceae bacterium]|nr:NADP-dependent malic enzyme [Fimbriimonadaceae bacterium]
MSPRELNTMSVREQDALDYHVQGRPGKLEVVPTKPCLTARDLYLAYSPGVAFPCLAIEKDPDLAYQYTNKGNLVGVVSNGTAVLGLGDIGALSGKPVMEGKAVLFKRFAQVDVFDIELNSKDPKEVISACRLLEPTFGGINLEDIKAPECFEVEEQLRKTLNIPVFHDDQHGTAIVSGAALINALEVVGKALDKVKIVVCGAGASAIACARFYEELGAPCENITLVDTKGVIFKGRTEGMNKYKEHFAHKTDARTLADAIRGSDVFLGCSVKGAVTVDMVKSMAAKPIIFALANPDPEIDYDVARAARPDAIIATGRSDYPNQVNNVLGFPFIFRGALDVRATAINENMKIAAAKALAELTKQPVTEEVSMAYGGQHFEFGPDYIIPKPFDPRVLHWEALAVAKAACESGVARAPITDWEAYRSRLESMTNRSEVLMRRIRSVTKVLKRKVVFPEGENPKVIEACREMSDEGIGAPLLLGRREIIEHEAETHHISLKGIGIVDYRESKDLPAFADELYKLRSRKGMTPLKAQRSIRQPWNYAMMMLRSGQADAMVAGADSPYSDTVRAILPLAELRPGVNRAVGLHVILAEGKVYIVGDTTINIDPDPAALADIAVQAAALARDFGLDPRVALLSFSNFGGSTHRRAAKVREAVEILHRDHPDIVADGEMHGDVAVVPQFANQNFPHSRIQGDANVLICPDLDSANIAFKLVGCIGRGREIIGPLVVGLKYPINVVSFNSDVREILNMACFSCYQAYRG